MGIFRKKNTGAVSESKKEPVLAAVIVNTVLSDIYQDILKNNEIRFICRQQGAGGYLKHLLGPMTIPDYIYVKKEDFVRARELYELYVEPEAQREILDSEED